MVVLSGRIFNFEKRSQECSKQDFFKINLTIYFCIMIIDPSMEVGTGSTTQSIPKRELTNIRYTI